MANSPLEVANALVDDFLALRLTFDQFVDAYAKHYLQGIPEEALSDHEWDYLDAIHERAEWTSHSLSQEAKRAGWIDVDSFRSWLTRHRHAACKLPSRVDS